MRKLFKLIVLVLTGAFTFSGAAGQANASINILTLNTGLVTLGQTVNIQVTIGNTGPASPIGTNKVRPQISVPTAICSILPNAQQIGLPSGWIILSNTGGVITVCNGTDVIPVGAQRQIYITVQGNTVGGPSTVAGNLSFGPGTGVCTGLGSLSGDNTADNISQSTIQVTPAASCNLGVTALAGTIVCNGGTTTLTATPTGAIGVVEYCLNGGTFQASSIFIVGAGTYTVTAREASNPTCTATAFAVTVTEPPVIPGPTVNVVQPTCMVSTGTITITSSTTGLTFSLDGGAYAAYPGSGYVIATGTHTLTAKNASGCISAVTNVTVNAQTALPAAPATSVVQPTCTVATGTITITSSTAGLTFSLDGGAYAAYPAGGYVVAAGAHTLTTQNAAGCISAVTSITVNAQPVTPAAPTIETIMQPTCAISTGSVVLGGLPFGNWTINPGALIGNTATTTLNGFAQGTYNFTVTNSESCISPASADVVISNVPGAPPPPTVNIVHPTCTVATGTITITSTTSGLTLSLDGGAYAAYPVGGYVAAAGAHTLTVQNTAFCTSPITNITINPQPQIPAAPTVSIVHPTCTVVTGTITITSPTTGLTFSLNGGAYVTYPASGYVVATGVHSLTAQYASGCISTVTNITVNPQPVSTTASVSAGSIACFGGSTTLAVTASGGPMPFEYSLNDGSFQSGNTFIVNAGTHTVTVRNANFCTTTTAVTVTQPAAFTAAASTSIIGCQGGTTTLIASARGGTGTLLYSLNGGTFQSGNAFIVGAGTYTVTVKDVNNCTAVTTAITIIQPATLTASATANRIIHCGGITAVTVAASGGITPYTSGVGTFTRGPGTWIFTVSDAGGCTDTTQVTIEAPGCMDLKVYPNPASNFINVYHSTAASGSSMQVFSINGALVLTKQVPQNAFQTTIDTGRLPAGSYLLVYLNGIEKKQTLFEKITTN